MQPIAEENIENSNTLIFNKTCIVHLLLLCAVQFLLGVFYLGSVPRFNIDEAWDASLGCELGKTGVLRHPFIQNFGGMEVYFIQPHVLLPIICAGVFKITGYSIFISRLPSLLMGVLAVVALYRIAEKFFGSRQSFFITLALIINIWFWVDSRRCRPEIYCAALGLVFLWLVILYFHRDQALIAFLAGLVAALASLTHPNGLLIVVAVSIGWLVWKEKPHLLKFVIWTMAGFILIILPYVIYVLWAVKNPNVSFVEQMQMNFPHSSAITREILRWRTFLQMPFGIPVALVMFVSWLAAWWKSTAQDKFVATVAAVYPLSLILCSVNILADYLVVIVPFCSILIVRFCYRLHEFDFLSGSRRMYYAVRLAVMLIYVVSSLPPIMLVLYCQRNADFNRVVDEVAKVIQPKARVHADPIFWAGHDRYIYGPYLMTYNTVTVEYALQWAYSQSFDYAIRTTWAEMPPRGFQKPPRKMPGFRLYLTTDNLCKLFGTKIYEFYNEDYGTIKIYKINWPPNPESWGLRKQGAK